MMSLPITQNMERVWIHLFRKKETQVNTSTLRLVMGYFFDFFTTVTNLSRFTPQPTRGLQVSIGRYSECD